MQKPDPPVDCPITVSVNNGQVEVDNDPCKISAARKDQVVWTCHDGLLTIEFEKDGCPFDKMKLAKKHPKHSSKRSGPALTGEQRTYHYSAKVQLDDGRELELDPEVVVDDDTPPPHRLMAVRPKPKKAKTKAKTKAKRKSAPKRKARKTAVKKKATKKKAAKKKAAKKRPAKRKATRGKAKKAARRPARRKVGKKKSARRRRGR